MFTRDKLDVRKLHHTVGVSEDIAQLDEGVSPSDRFKGTEQKMMKPLALEYFQSLIILLPVFVDNDKSFKQRLVITLNKTAREVQIYKSIRIDGIKGAALRIVNVERYSPGGRPDG